jgi:transcriptional regulator with XRE-family HTH domain
MTEGQIITRTEEQALIDFIKDAQKTRGWSDGELARQMNASQSTWSRIQKGERPINLDFMRGACKAMPEIKLRVAKYVTG